jgi:ATP dependent DNA ligase domain
VSRQGRDHTKRFAGIAAAITKLSARTLVLDAEVAIYDDHLRSRFDLLRDPDPNAVATPPLLMAFDLMYLDGRDVTQRPLLTGDCGLRSWSSATSPSSWCGGWRTTGWWRGGRCWSAATRATSQRTSRTRTRAD